MFLGLAMVSLVMAGAATDAETVTVTATPDDGPLGQATILTVSAPTVTQPAWQWRHLGRALLGQTAERLLVPHLPQNLGAYDVVLRQTDGVWCSSPVALTKVATAADGTPVGAARRSTPTFAGKGAALRRIDGPSPVRFVRPD